MLSIKSIKNAAQKVNPKTEAVDKTRKELQRKRLKMKKEELSREVSYALRHAPWEYELEMDAEGWVFAEQLLTALRRSFQWRNITIKDLEEMIQTSEKKRHELRDGKIRAFYGHSIPGKLLKEERKPPERLYHGTARASLTSILEFGLLPQKRQYVHLSQDIETAQLVGQRRDPKPSILNVDAKKAWEEGIKFYYGNEKVWLADQIPAKYLEVE